MKLAVKVCRSWPVQNKCVNKLICLGPVRPDLVTAVGQSVVATTAHCTLLMIKLCCCVWAGFCVVSCVDILQISFPLGTIKLKCFGASAHSSYIKVS